MSIPMTGQQLFYAAASAAALLSFAAHTFVGGRIIAARVLAGPAMAGRARLSFRYCWHFVTVELALVAAGYAFLFSAPANAALASFLAANAAMVSLVAIVLARGEGVSPLTMPPTTLGALIAVLGAAGLLAGSAAG